MGTGISMGILVDKVIGNQPGNSNIYLGNFATGSMIDEERRPEIDKYHPVVSPDFLQDLGLVSRRCVGLNNGI